MKTGYGHYPDMEIRVRVYPVFVYFLLPGYYLPRISMSASEGINYSGLPTIGILH